MIVSATAGTYTIPKNFAVMDDDIDEIEQSFALVAELGRDVPERFVCFQTGVGTENCFGRRGVTEIKIVDNDGESSLGTPTSDSALMQHGSYQGIRIVAKTQLLAK